MTQSRLPVRQIRELLHLHFEHGLSQCLIARSLGAVHSTVGRMIKRFAATRLAWPPDPVLTDAEMERRLYRGPAHTGSAKTGIRHHCAEVSSS